MQLLDVVVVTVVLLALLAGNDRIRHSAVASVTPLAVRLATLAPPPEVDEAADELYRALRRERLRADVRRVERLLRTDTAMSATRQIGNRLAYGWLVRDLERSTAELPPWLDDTAAGPDPFGAGPGGWTGRADQDRRHHPKVEILTIGWR